MPTIKRTEHAITVSFCTSIFDLLDVKGDRAEQLSARLLEDAVRIIVAQSHAAVRSLGVASD
jgi:hypothetical protein